MRRLAVMVSVMVVLAACSSGGGGAASEEPAGSGGSQAALASQASAPSEGGNGDGGNGGGPAGLGAATVTIGSETYRFGETSVPALRCDPDLFGIFWVLLNAVDESGAALSGGRVEMVLPSEDAEVEETPKVRFSTLDDEWIASEQDVEDLGLPAGSSGVGSFTISGNSVSGTATFYSESSYFESSYFASSGGGELVTAEGSFEATCSG